MIWTADGAPTTTDTPALLSTLMEWTTSADIIAAMIRVGAADGEGMWQLAQHIKATAAEMERSKLVGGDEAPLDPNPVAAEVMDERMIAQAMLAFLTAEKWRPGAKWPDERVADTLADYVRKIYGRRRESAISDLRHLAVELRDRHGIRKAEIPRFRKLPPEAVSMVKRAQEAREVGAEVFKNEDLCQSNILPLIALYGAAHDTIGPDLARRLREMPQSLQEIAIRFPPDSLVRSEGDLICPALGYLAVVSGYGIEPDSREPIVMVAASDDPEALTANCHPDWLILVACRGEVTQAAVAGVLSPERPN